MPYEVFARKYRPKTFNEVVGQEPIVRTLQNAIKSGRIGQAYLFSGMRGTGKTTIARILAKALNCEHGPAAEPCNRCEICSAINNGSAIDVIEIDGASNRGINEIRALQEALSLKPLQARYKVVIIDEVHQITKDGFNALLKTLEEPPPYVIFVFATTEYHKVPLTIVSRCQRFEFKKMTVKEIAAALSRIARLENINIAETGLAMIAQAADGSMRDAQSFLDQALAFSGNIISEDDLRIILGTFNQEILLDIARAIIDEKPSDIFPLIEKVTEAGYDLRYLYAKLVEYFRAMFIVKTTPQFEHFLIMTKDELQELEKLSLNLSADDLLRYLTALQAAESGLRYSSFPRIYMETFLVRLSMFRKLMPLEQILARVENLKEELADHKKSEINLEKGEQASISSLAREPVRQNVKKHDPNKAASPASLFDRALEKIAKDRAALAAVLKEYSSVRLGGNVLEVIFKPGKGFLATTIQPDNLRPLEKELSRLLGREINLRFSEENLIHGESVKPSRLIEIALKDPEVRYFMDTFKAQIVSVEQIKSDQETAPAKSLDNKEKSE